MRVTTLVEETPFPTILCRVVLSSFPPICYNRAMRKAIFIAAGRGRRLMPLTEEVPKCYAEIGGRRILDWCVAALRSAGLDDIVFVGGYRIERVRADYPGFRFCDNAAWESNNILSSLF